jgi:hypothetical protein
MTGIDKYTVLDLHMQGADDGTSFPDSSFVNPKTATAVGTVETSTSEATLGQTSSAYFEPAGGRINISASEDFEFGDGDFTIDCWLYPTDATTRRAIFSGNTDQWVGIDYNYHGTRNVNIWAGAGAGWNIIQADSGPCGHISLTLNAWNHFAYVRYGNQFMSFVNGVMDINATAGGTIVPRQTEDKSIGTWAISGMANFEGYIQEFRVSKGIARWTANFTPPTAPYTAGFASGSAGVAHSLLLRGDGVVFAAGNNTYGQLGNGAALSPDPTTVDYTLDDTYSCGTDLIPISLSPGTYYHFTYGGTAQKVQLFSAGSSLLLDNAVYAYWDGTSLYSWGGSAWTEVEEGTPVSNVNTWGGGTLSVYSCVANHNITAFTQITTLSSIRTVAAGGYHSLALDSSGNVWATGLNDHGQLGLGDTDNLNTWTQVTALSGIVSIAAGEYHSIAIDSDGHVWAWGYDSTGQLGDGLTADVSTPEQVM